ncbi:hypothetical protein [Sulfitobacter geojensis]|uniref:hypothetical protein n=1 Tax=Sulfitobacter geojensis TaxID=1342299 RepID=UPI003B8BA21D
MSVVADLQIVSVLKYKSNFLLLHMVKTESWPKTGCFRQVFESATALSGRFRGRLGVENGSMNPMDLRISIYFNILGAFAELWMPEFGFLAPKEQISFGFLCANKQS